MGTPVYAVILNLRRLPSPSEASSAKSSQAASLMKPGRPASASIAGFPFRHFLLNGSSRSGKNAPGRLLASRFLLGEFAGEQFPAANRWIGPLVEQLLLAGPLADCVLPIPALGPVNVGQRGRMVFQADVVCCRVLLRVDRV